MRPLAILVLCIIATGCQYDSELRGRADRDEVPETIVDAGSAPEVATEPPPYVPACGNGTLDEGEECDDGNTNSLDGCDPDCTYSCHVDADCDMRSHCSVDSCDTTRHICVHAPVDCRDDEECTYDTCVAARGCQHRLTGPWYRDADRDCWGWEGDSVCGLESVPEGYTANVGDCCDREHNVSPFETEYFYRPHDCDGTMEPSFDYNCNGTPERRWIEPGSCSTGTGGGCFVSEGWLGSVPGCGVEGRWLTECRADPETGACSPHHDIARIQPCR